MIYTLDYLHREAANIQSAWNGENDRFFYDGNMIPSEYVPIAQELEEKLEEIEDLIIELSL